MLLVPPGLADWVAVTLPFWGLLPESGNWLVRVSCDCAAAAFAWARALPPPKVIVKRRETTNVLKIEDRVASPFMKRRPRLSVSLTQLLAESPDTERTQNQGDDDECQEIR